MINQVVQIGSSSVPGMVKVSGYVAEFGQRDMYGGPAHGGYTERLNRDVFARALNRHPDVRLVVDGRALARTRTGTLRLSVDNVGMRMEAEVHAAEANRIRSGTLSCTFEMRKDGWNEELTRREIEKVSLHGSDVIIRTVEELAKAAQEQARSTLTTPNVNRRSEDALAQARMIAEMPLHRLVDQIRRENGGGD